MLPIRVCGALVGSVGVGRGSPEQDRNVAEAAIAYLENGHGSQPDNSILGACHVELSPTEAVGRVRRGLLGGAFNTTAPRARFWSSAGTVVTANRIHANSLIFVAQEPGNAPVNVAYAPLLAT